MTSNPLHNKEIADASSSEGSVDLNALYEAEHGTLPDASPIPKPGIVAYRLNQIETESVEWLWQDRIALGKLTILVGLPDSGKSFFTIALAAALSRGDMLPGDTTERDPIESLIFELEDGLADTVKPRALKCNAVLERIHVAQSVRPVYDTVEKPFTLADVEHLDRLLEQHPQIRLVVINPLAAVMSSGTNDDKERDVRGELSKLDLIARKHNVAVLCIKHFNKRAAEEGPLNRISGSIAFSGAVRSVLGIESDVAHSDRRVLISLKSNLSKRATPVAFEINDLGLQFIGEDPQYDGTTSPRVTATSSCVKWLVATLKDGAQPSTEVYAAAELAGHSKRTVERARKIIGVDTVKLVETRGSAWYMRLPRPKSEAPSGSDPTSQADNLTREAA